MSQSGESTLRKRLLTGASRLWLLTLVIFTTACTTPGSSLQPLSAAEKDTQLAITDQTILGDLANVVTQIFDPFETTLQVNDVNDDPALQYFIDLLIASGYGIQRVSADQGAHYVSYKREESKPDRFTQISYSVSVGAVEVARDYFVPRRNVVAPTSTVRLSGTRVPVTIDDTPGSRKLVVDSALSQAQYFASLNLDEQAPVISLITPQLVERVSTQSTDGPTLQALNSSKVEVNNLFYGGESTFSSLLDDYAQIDRQIIIFGNDSMVLGDTNKSLIDQFVESQFQRGDLVSLVGCSNGPTALEIGNEGLALGRAQRVTEALLARGIARDDVLDEGCWAPVRASERFPSRGVVMELWRKSS